MPWMRLLLLLLMPLFLAHVDALVPLLVLVALLLVAKKFLMKKKRPRKKNLTTTVRSPTRRRMKTHQMTAPTMMMRSRPFCSFHSLFGT
jgi:predicted ABC-type exoprotein transport system permease subunit